MPNETVFVELRALISQFQAKMAEARGEMERTAKHGGATFAGLAKVSGAALAGVAGVAVAVGTFATKMGMDLQDADRRLRVAITDSGNSFEAFAPQIAKADKQLEKFGFTNAQTNDALAVMVTGLGKPAKALEAIGVAADLATFKHVDLAQAALAVTKAIEGNMRPLHQLGIDLPIAASSAYRVTVAQQNLAKAQAALTAAEAAEHPTAAQIVADRLSAEKAALALQRAQDAVTLAQQNEAAVLHKFPDAAKAGAAGHQLLVDASMKLKLAEEAASLAAQQHGTVLNQTGPHAKYEAAVLKVADAQAKLSALQKAGTGILDALQKKIGGQAADASQTFAGRLQVAKARVEDLAARLGLKLIPIIEQVIAAITRVVSWFDRHRAAAVALAGVITAVLGAAMTVFVVDKIARFVGGIQSAIGALSKLAGRSTATAATVEGDSAAMGAASTGFGSKLSGGLAVASAGIIAFQGTMALLKSNFLGIGDAVTSAARAITNFLGIHVGTSPTAKLAPASIAWLEAVAAGQLVDAKISAADAAAQLHQLHIPGYKYGGYVPTTGLALLHAGETVIPADGGGGRGDLVLVVDGQVLGRVVLSALLREQRNRPLGIRAS